MSEIPHIEDRPRLGGSYFFLSYAHSPPLAGSVAAESDQWVRRFFDDLTAAVRRLAATPSMAAGSFFQDLPLASGWKASLTQALSVAEVFVPLLSPGYYTRSWPGREWACFERRLTDAGLGATERARRFAPVLWIPVPGGQERPGLKQALALGSSEQAYAENGLRALLRLAPYRGSYELVVDRLASRIVELAEFDPLKPSAAPEFDEVPSAFHPTPDAASFVVMVAAPTLAELPPDRDRAGYGDRSVDWRAYPDDQDLPLADYAAQAAEQLDFAVEVAGIAGPAEPNLGQPGVLLIDPWIATDQPSLRRLEDLVSGLPSWVRPLLVLDQVPDARGDELADQVRGIVSASPTGRLASPAFATHAVTGIRTLRDFVTLMPILVTEAERQYLRHSSDAVSSGQRSRFWPRLTASPS